ncbi:hypothetical protein D3C87_1442860 [compost metagenome]
MTAFGAYLEPGEATHKRVTLRDNRLLPAALGAMKSKWRWRHRHDIPQRGSFGPSLPRFDIDGRSLGHRLSAISAS